MLKIKCFGDFQVELNNKIISNFETEKSRALLAYLAVESGRPLRRTHLAGLLWSDESEKRALHNLRQTLSRLRKTMGEDFADAQYLIADRDSLQFNPCAEIWVDTAVFSNDLQLAYQFYQSAEGRGLINYQPLKHAVGLYHGEFLAEYSSTKSILFEEWVLLLREKYHLQAIRALSDLSNYYERRGEFHLALEVLYQLVELAPWDETATARVIHLCGLTQQWHVAHSKYLFLKTYLLEQLNVEPSPSLVTLHLQTQKAASENKKLEPTIPPIPHYLPQDFTSFVGRENEVGQLLEMISNPEIGLITLAGPGGIGKTSLALNLAQQLIGVFSHGVFFVSCLTVQNPEQLYHLIGGLTGLVFNDQSEYKKQVIDHLRQKQVLLVLDNFEHLVPNKENIGFVNDLLFQAPAVTILITSREKLNLQQEFCYLLKGLNFPVTNQISLEEAKTFDAVALFIKKMHQLNNDFKLSETELLYIVQICRILEGLPLGITLAAAACWEQGFSLVIENLHKNLDVVKTNFHFASPRHRDLRSVFDVSWALLTQQEQKILANLSLFRGGFDRQAAQIVTNADAHVLTALVAKSLVRQVEADRLDLHEVIRQFAAEKLGQSGRMGEMKIRHARYYADFLTDKNETLFSSQQATVLTEIQNEFSNLYLMWNTLVQQQLCKELLMCVNSIYQFFSIRSLTGEGIEWLRYALNNLSTTGDCESAQGILLSYLGALANQGRKRELARESLISGQKLLSQVNALKELAFCNLHLGWFYWYENQFIEAEKYAQQSMLSYQDLNENAGVAESLFLWGNIRQKQSKNHEAKEFFDQALLLCRPTGNQRLLILILNRLSDLACYEGFYQIAVEQFKECLQISHQLQDRHTQAVLLNNLGTIYHVWNEYSIAQNYYQQSLLLCREIGDLDGAALSLNNLGEIATALGNYPNAIKYVQEALQIADQNGETWTQIACLNSLGELHLKMNQNEMSEKTLLSALESAVSIQAMDLIIRISVNLGRVYQKRGDISNAVLLLKGAVAHKSTEEALREIAIVWLKEMESDFPAAAVNDDLLGEAVKKICLAKIPPSFN